MSEFTYSGKNSPCPLCGRTKDKDCHWKPGFVLCHTHLDKADIPGWKYLGESGGNWGLWLLNTKQKEYVRDEPFKTMYPYPARDGSKLARVDRFDFRDRDGKHSKNFFQNHWNGTEFKKGLPKNLRGGIPIYRYAEIQDAIAKGEKILFVEGEKTANALWDIGIPATTTIGGSKGFDQYGDYSNDLEGASIVIAPDRDKGGMEYAKKVADFFETDLWCKFGPKQSWEDSNLDEKGGLDLFDWIHQGATKQDILDAISKESNGKSYEDLVRSALDIHQSFKGGERDYELIKLAKDYKISPQKLEYYVAIEKQSDSKIQVDLESAIAERVAHYELMDGKPSSHYSTGFKQLDEVLGGGLRPGSVCTVAGATRMGKTSFALSSILNNYKKNLDPKVLLISAEMSASDLVDKLVQYGTSIDLAQLSKGLSERQWKGIYSMHSELSNLKLNIIAKPIALEAIKAECEKAQNTMNGLDCIVLDYIQLMLTDRSRSRVEELSNLTRGIKQLAMALEVPVIQLAQINRSVDSRGGGEKKPRLSDIRESGSIEQDSDYVLGLYRDEVYDPYTNKPGIADVIVLKNRHGSSKNIELAFDRGLFREYNF